jgi:hypothetical protein
MYNEGYDQVRSVERCTVRDVVRREVLSDEQ